MFSGMKMEEFMESEHSGIFRVELVTKDVMPGSSGTHFMHMRVKLIMKNDVQKIRKYFRYIYVIFIIRYWKLCSKIHQ